MLKTRCERIEAAAELERSIPVRYPDAKFSIGRSPASPHVVHLKAAVDVDDEHGVLDLVIDRVLDYQDNEHLPIHVIPVQRLREAVEAARPAAGRRRG